MPESFWSNIRHIKEFWPLYSAGTGVFSLLIVLLAVGGWTLYGDTVKDIINEDVKAEIQTVSTKVDVKFGTFEQSITRQFDALGTSLDMQTRSLNTLLEKVEDLQQPNEVAVYEHGEVLGDCGTVCDISFVVRRHVETVDCELQLGTVEHILVSNADQLRRKTTSIPGSAPSNVGVQPTNITYKVRIPQYFPRSHTARYQVCMEYKCPWHDPDDPNDTVSQCSPKHLMPFTLTVPGSTP